MESKRAIKRLRLQRNKYKKENQVLNEINRKLRKQILDLQRINSYLNTKIIK